MVRCNKNSNSDLNNGIFCYNKYCVFFIVLLFVFFLFFCTNSIVLEQTHLLWVLVLLLFNGRGMGEKNSLEWGQCMIMVWVILLLWLWMNGLYYQCWLFVYFFVFPYFFFLLFPCFFLFILTLILLSLFIHTLTILFFTLLSLYFFLIPVVWWAWSWGGTAIHHE